MTTPPPGPAAGPEDAPGAAGDPWRQAERWFTDPPAPSDRVCEVCGGRLDADQTYCLECGSPTPLAPRLQRPSRAAAFAAGAVVALALGAGALALAAMDGGGGTAVGTVVTAPVTAPVPTGTGPVFTAPPVPTGTLPADTNVTVPGTLPPGLTSTAGTLPADTSVTVVPPSGTGFATVTAPPTIPTAPTVPTTTATVPPAQTVPPASLASDWPAGRTAYTVVLSSVRDAAEARATEDRVRAAGEEAGVLVSSEHPNLRPGYFVVFSGVFDARETALARAEDLRTSFPGAYAREVRS